MAHANGMESFGASLKRGYEGIYHHMSPKYLGRYVECEGRRNRRPMDTADQIGEVARRADSKWLRYIDLIGPPETRQPA